MANIIELYRKYQSRNSAELSKILKKVTKEILQVTENIPEDVVIRNFMTNSFRRYINFYERKYGFLHVEFCDEIYVGEYPYDTSAFKELEKFISNYYPGIVPYRSYTLDLYNNTISFSFGFELEFKDEDFSYIVSYSPMLIYNKDEKNINGIIDLFNDDISSMLNCKFNRDSWSELHKHVMCVDGQYIKTDRYDSGMVYVEFPID